MASTDRVTELDELTSAVVETARLSARKEWGQEPRLYALVRRAALTPFNQALPEEVRDAAQASLIPIEQHPLEEGEPAAVLARVRWPDGVEGCVLVTELVTLPPDVRDKASNKAAAAVQWEAGHPERRMARLTVGVLRDGSYACCLQLRGKDEGDLLINNDLADDVVAALLGTF